MRFACENCQTRYTLADEKIRGRILKIRCRTCSAIMVVRDPELPPVEAETGSQPRDSTVGAPRMPSEGSADETRQISAAAVQELLRAAAADDAPADGGGEADATRVVSVASVQALLKQSRRGEPQPATTVEGAGETQSAKSAGGAGETQSATTAAEAPVVPDPIDRAEELRRAITGGGFTEEWWAMAGSEQLGPMSRTRLLTLLDEGVVTQRSYIWRDGMEDWQRLGDVEGLVGAGTASPSGMGAEANVGAGAAAPAPDAAVESWSAALESAGSESQRHPTEAWSEATAPDAAEMASWTDATDPNLSSTQPASDPHLSGWGREDDTAEIDRSSTTPGEAFPVASTHERILASIEEETTGPILAASRPPEAGQPAAPSRAADARGLWRTLRLVAAGTVLAASFAAGAYFFVPAGETEERARALPGGGGAGRVVLADFELPDRSPLERNAVGEALAERVPGFSRCVETHPAGSRQRRIVIRAVVAPSGVVTSASVSSGDAGGELGSCLADRTRDIRFPGFAGEAVVISFPLLVVGNAP